VIFLIVFVNLIGFGIIIPLLPFYATRMGASAFTVGLLFASYSVAQLIAAPVLGSLSDRWGRRPVLIFSLVGTVASFAMLAVANSVVWVFASRIVDGLSGGNISTARAYIGDVTTLENRAKGFGLIGAAFGLGFIVGPALGGALGHLSYAAPAWAAPGAPWAGIAVMVRRPVVGRLLVIDFLYWMTFAAYQTTFALFGARRFGFDVPQTGYLLAVVGALAVVTQVAAVGPVVRRFGERRTLACGLTLAGLGLLIATLSHHVAVFAVALVPGAVGVALAIPSLTSLISQSAARDEQGRVQGVSSALEGLGRTVGPVWGNGVLGFYSEGAAFGTAAAVLLGTAWLAARVRSPDDPARGAAG
jgi:DHA1 family tetracycline resistance protein-like MFS transporter